MSDLQDLIHTNAHNAYEIGVRTERERIIKILTTNQCQDENHPGECITFIANVDHYLALIEGQ